MLFALIFRITQPCIASEKEIFHEETRTIPNFCMSTEPFNRNSRMKYFNYMQKQVYLTWVMCPDDIRHVKYLGI